MRYVNLSIVLVFRLVSTKVHQRFPSYQSLVEAKLLLQHESDRLVRAEQHSPHESTWTPVLWALKLLERARTEGKIKIEAPVWSNLVSSFEYIETSNRKILNHGWVNFPIAYTQVATISVFAYFLASLFGTQYLIPEPAKLDNVTFPILTPILSFSTEEPYKAHTPDFKFPVFTVLEFISYMGWIKVAETLLNPFGDDDEDFQINYLIDRNLQTSYLIVDEADREIEMADDPFLEAGIQIPAALPYQDETQKDESAKRVLGDRKSSDQKMMSRPSSFKRRQSRQNRLESVGNISAKGALESIVEFTSGAGIPRGSRVRTTTVSTDEFNSDICSVDSEELRGKGNILLRKATLNNMEKAGKCLNSEEKRQPKPAAPSGPSGSKKISFQLEQESPDTSTSTLPDDGEDNLAFDDEDEDDQLASSQRKNAVIIVTPSSTDSNPIDDGTVCIQL